MELWLTCILHVCSVSGGDPKTAAEPTTRLLLGGDLADRDGEEGKCPVWGGGRLASLGEQGP